MAHGLNPRDVSLADVTAFVDTVLDR